MKNLDLIACTTTGAAKYMNLLRNINSKILIVEEAGQINEPNLLSAITPHIEQIIMIGDH